MTASTDGFMGIPVTELGTEYYNVSYLTDNYLYGYSNIGSTLGVVATVDNTVLEITPSVDAQTRPAGVPFNITLNAGETYQLISQNYGSAGDLTGSKVTSTEPVGMFGSHVCANVPANVVACDHLVEMIPPTNTWGTQFLTASLETRTGGDIFRVVSSEDNNQVTLNGGVVATINEGEFLELDLASDSYNEITTTEASLLAQFSKGSDADGANADPFMMIIPPFEQYSGNFIFSTPTTTFNENYVNILTPASGVGNIDINGTLIPAADFEAIGTSGFFGTRQDLPMGLYAISGNVPFGAFVYGYEYFDSYGYPANQIYSSVAIVENLDINPPSATVSTGDEHCFTVTLTDQYGNAIENVTLTIEIDGANTIYDFGVTDADGIMTYCYTSYVEGTDSILVTLGNDFVTASVEWISIPSGCTDEYACNYDPDAQVDDGSCEYESCADCEGVPNGPALPGTACDDNDPTTLDDVYQQDCSCSGEAIPGCTDDYACNYNPDATADNGSCEYESCADCEGVPNGPALPGTDCDDNDPTTLNDVYLADCTCSGEAIPGCTDDYACNYNPDATADDGSCEYESCADCEGVPNGPALPGTACDDGNAATLDDEYQADCSCAGFTIPGCTDDYACNYDPDATADDGSCEYDSCADCEGVPNGDALPGTACDDGDDTTTNDTYSADCDCIGELLGCTEPDACNYNPDAIVDDGTCDFVSCADCEGVPFGPALPGTACDDGNADTTNDTYDADCNCIGEIIPGCTDPDALNFDPEASLNDGCCIYECTSEEGTIMITSGGSYGNESFICFGDQVIVDADDFLLIPCQSVYYVYHTAGPNVTEADLPLDPSDVITLGSFFVNDTGKEEIYVTAFGALNDGEGGPDYEDPCITVSNTLTIQLLDPISVTVEEDCDTDSGEFTYNFVLTGGLPECVPGATYTVNGDFWNGNPEAGETITVGPITDGESYNMDVEDSNGCAFSFGNSIQCEKLPVELISLEGSAEAEGNLIKWTTASEIENDYFTLSSSLNGVDFVEIATISGNGTTANVNNYAHLDRNAESGITYYQLKQTDFDGSNEVIGVVAIERGEAVSAVSIFPNPVVDVINITGTVEAITLNVYDLNGKLVYTIADTREQINLSSLSSGTYVIEILGDSFRQTERLIKL